MIGERRRHGFEKAMIARITLIWAIVSALLLATQFRNIAAVIYPDGDDILRLLQVRDWLNGQTWFDVTQYRVDPPEGTPMHWTRLVDVPLAAIIVLLTPVIGNSGAEIAASVIVPLATLWLVLMLIGRISFKIFDEEATGLACLVAAMSTSLLNQLRPMRIDHHGWQVVCALVAVNALMARNARQGGWIAGFAMAAWLAISLEAIPMVAAIMAVGLWRWMRCWHERTWLVSMLQSIFVSSLVIYLATKGLPMGASVCDAMAPAPLAAMGILAIGATGLDRATHRPFSFALMAFGALGVAAVAVEFTLAPQCTGGTFAELDPLTRSLWLGNIAEGRPIWEGSISLALLKVIPPLIALVTMWNLIRRHNDWLGRWHQEYAFLLIVALVVGCLVARTSVYSAALAAVPLGWQLKVWLRSIRTLKEPGKQAAAAAGIITALAPAVPISLLMAAAPTQASTITSAPVVAVADCDIRAALPALGATPARIFAPIDLGPRILLDSPHSVLATAHHRADVAIADTMRAFMDSPDEARAMLDRRGYDYMMLCAGMNEVNAYATIKPDGFAADLQKGEIPDWLEPVENESQNVLVLKIRG